jgi:hypothetical protein
MSVHLISIGYLYNFIIMSKVLVSLGRLHFRYDFFQTLFSLPDKMIYTEWQILFYVLSLQSQFITGCV